MSAGTGGAGTGAGLATVGDGLPKGSPTGPARLTRALTLPLVVLYGLGVTIGAGIYVLIGAAAGAAGSAAPLAFVLAALVMAPSGLSFAELAQRMPVSAGEAAYAAAAFRSRLLTLAVGLMVAVIGIVSASAISLGAVGYIRVFLDWPHAVLTPLVVLAMGAVAAWGIRESVSLAAVMTLIEIGGLVIVILAGLIWGSGADTIVATEAAGTIPAGGLFTASLLAFFAFVGFESIVNVAEEVKDPLRTVPRAIFLTLVVATALYVLVTLAALRTVSPGELAGSEAPLALVFSRATGGSPAFLGAIAIIATLNGIVVQFIMASRVLYGLADRGEMPALLARVSPVTHTPLVATGLVVALAFGLAASFPIAGLAEWTSRLTLLVFGIVNAALLVLKWRSEPSPEGAMNLPIAVPAAGTVVSAGFLLAEWLV